MIMSLEPVIVMFSFLEIAEITHFNHSTAFIVCILFHFLDLYNANLIIFALASIPVMKLKTIILAAVTLLVFLTGNRAAYAQSAPLKSNFDTEIWRIRNNCMPEFRYHYDDYLRYAPAAVMVGMKAFGYESRNSWGRMLVSDAFSFAIMAGAVKGIKYTVDRLRPDGSQHNSFPSGHTATAFMTATLLHMEYGWKNPWFSIGGYSVAAITGVSRLFNNKHWLTDVIAGAGAGIGAVHLGYFLGDLIFKEKQICDGYVKPKFLYDSSQRHYVAELVFGHRFIIAPSGEASPTRGGLAGVSVDVPFAPGLGVTGRACASSLTYSSMESMNVYSALAGGFYNLHFAKVLELQAKVMAGYAWGMGGSGADLCAGISLSLITGNNFKIKAFADLESMSLNPHQPWLNTAVIGFGSGWFW